MKTTRREFGKAALGGALTATLPNAGAGETHLGFLESPQAPATLAVLPGIKIANTIAEKSTPAQLDSFRQCGVECASVWSTAENPDYDYFVRLRRLFNAHQVEIYNIGILNLHCDPTIVLQLPGYQERYERYKSYLTDLGRAGIHYTTMAFMANIMNRPYFMTGTTTVRGGASARFFDLAVADKLPLSNGRVYTEDDIWKSFTDFMHAIMPTAEKAGVRIGLHPDDPPVPSLGGVARVFRNFEGYQRALQIADSENFGICLCIGTWSEGGPATGKSAIEMIRYFGAKGRIFKIHFRNVSSYLPRFHETFVDEGYQDMYGVMRALRDVNFSGIVIPDHVPAGADPMMNVAFTIGYMKAFRDRVNAEFIHA